MCRSGYNTTDDNLLPSTNKKTDQTLQPNYLQKTFPLYKRSSHWLHRFPRPLVRSYNVQMYATARSFPYSVALTEKCLHYLKCWNLLMSIWMQKHQRCQKKLETALLGLIRLSRAGAAEVVSLAPEQYKTNFDRRLRSVPAVVESDLVYLNRDIPTSRNNSTSSKQLVTKIGRHWIAIAQ